MGDSLGQGLEIAGPHGPVRLKWHKLRRRPEDFPFDRRNLQSAMALGASCEVDLRQMRDGGFVCLHDEELDRETSGSGSVDRADRESIRSLRLRHPKTGELGDPPQLLEELVETLTSGDVHGETVVQLDVKDKRPAPAAALDRFAAALDGSAHLFVASGTSWPAIAALGEAVPSLRLGFDPSRIALKKMLWPDRAEKLQEFAHRVMATAPQAKIIYLPYLLVTNRAAADARFVEIFQSEGFAVDCWTLDPSIRDIRKQLSKAIEMGVDQITTNAPLALESLWRDIAAGSGGPGSGNDACPS